MRLWLVAVLALAGCTSRPACATLLAPGETTVLDVGEPHGSVVLSSGALPSCFDVDALEVGARIEVTTGAASGCWVPIAATSAIAGSMVSGGCAEPVCGSFSVTERSGCPGIWSLGLRENRDGRWVLTRFFIAGGGPACGRWPSADGETAVCADTFGATPVL